MQKNQKRALRFVLKDSVSDYKSLLSKSGVDSFRILTMKNMAVEIYKILNKMGPGYLSSLFEKSNVPYQLRDNNKLVQPLKRTTTFGIKSFAYFGAHLWNLLPLHIKESVSLYNFKSLVKKWSGPTCSCCVCSIVVWCFAFIYFNPFCRSYHILSTTLYCVCTLLLYTSHWKCLFRTEYLFQETLYIYIYIQRRQWPIYFDLNSFWFILFKFYFICCIRIYMDRIEYFAFLFTNLYVQNVNDFCRRDFTWFIVVNFTLSWCMNIVYIVHMYIYIYIYHSGRWLALIVNKS